jgi:LysM repeat protein
MKKRTSFFARILAALALVAAVLAVVLIVSSASKESSSDKGHKSATTKQEPKKQRTKAATYTVKPGDTLIAIAHKTGIPVSEIQALNPEVDPQILENGEILKLK